MVDLKRIFVISQAVDFTPTSIPNMLNSNILGKYTSAVDDVGTKYITKHTYQINHDIAG